MPKRFIIVKGKCGLGNRLMTLANAMEYCEKTGRALCVDWCDGMFATKGENAFAEYFEVRNLEWADKIDDVSIEKGRCYPDVIKNIPADFTLEEYFRAVDCNKSRNKLLARMVHWGSSIAHVLLSEDSFKYYFILWKRWELRETFWGQRSKKRAGNRFCLGGDLPLSRKEEVIVFADFCPVYKKVYIQNYLRLKENILKEIKAYSNKHHLKQRGLGLHVRCTDKSFGEDIDELFEIVDKFLIKYKLEKIFLASDQKNILLMARERYGNKLLLYDKYIPDLNNGGTLGIHTWAMGQSDEQLKKNMYHDAVMEMYLLAEAKVLLYQGNSTFSTISSDLKDDNKCFDWIKCIENEKTSDKEKK